MLGMSSAMPWRIKILAKIVLSRLPIDYALWQKIGLFRHGHMDKADYALRVFKQHVVRAGLDSDLRGKRIVELGPGDSIATAIVAFAHGASAILVDVDEFVSDNGELYVTICEKLRGDGLPVPSITASSSNKEILELCNARYLTSGLESIREIADSSVDLCFSHAVLEHIRADTFDEMSRELHRILKPSGCCTHNVDLKDHLGGGLNNLRFSSKIWESPCFVKSGFYTNRISNIQMLDSFKAAGFNIAFYDFANFDSIPIKREELASEFRDRSEESLLVKEFRVKLLPAKQKSKASALENGN